MGAGVVKFGGLADDDGAGAYDQYFLRLVCDFGASLYYAPTLTLPRRGRGLMAGDGIYGRDGMGAGNIHKISLGLGFRGWQGARVLFPGERLAVSGVSAALGGVAGRDETRPRFGTEPPRAGWGCRPGGLDLGQNAGQFDQAPLVQRVEQLAHKGAE